MMNLRNIFTIKILLLKWMLCFLISPGGAYCYFYSLFFVYAHAEDL